MPTGGWRWLVMGAAALLVAGVTVWLVMADGEGPLVARSRSGSSSMPGSTTPLSDAQSGSSTTTIAGSPQMPSTTTGTGRSGTPPTTKPAGATETTAASTRDVSSTVSGAWGGRGIALNATPSGGTTEYDCATGTIDEPIRPDQHGNFKAIGRHAFESGGPAGPGAPTAASQPARYEGWTDGAHMRLTVTLTTSGNRVGTYELTKGAPAALEKCV